MTSDDLTNEMPTEPSDEVAQYVRRSIFVLAIRWTGDNTQEVLNFVRENGGIISSFEHRPVSYLIVQTECGGKAVYAGNYVVHDEIGDFHVTSEKIFSTRFVRLTATEG